MHNHCNITAIKVQKLTDACLDAEGNALGTDGDWLLSNQFLMQYLRHQKLCSDFGYTLNFSVVVSSFNVFVLNFHLQMLRLNKASVQEEKKTASSHHSVF